MSLNDLECPIQIKGRFIRTVRLTYVCCGFRRCFSAVAELLVDCYNAVLYSIRTYSTVLLHQLGGAYSPFYQFLPLAT